MKYHKFFYHKEPDANSFIESISGNFQAVCLPRFSEGKEPVVIGYMVDVCGEDWEADMTNEVRPTTNDHWFAGMEQDYFNSIT